ncbi:hypothetical protein IID22_00760 [Patescibacteria group bacterium]|nr:hypothetical protein [Patescibacteria group bacterium]
MAAPETERPRPPEDLTEHPVELPPEVERTGAKVTRDQVTAQVTDDQGKQLIQSPATQVVTIQIPAAQAQLEDWSHGSPANSLTWFATFWLRLIKKALHFGWRVVTGSNPN